MALPQSWVQYTLFSNTLKPSILPWVREIIIFDLAIFVKAKQIQWRFANKFSNVVSWLGTFHIARNFLTIIDKKYLNLGLEDLPIVSGMPQGLHPYYNRGMQTHKLCLEAFFRLVGPEFVKWYTISSSCEQSRPISQEQLRAIISSGVAEVEKWENIPKVCISQTKRRSEGLALCIRCI